MPLSRKQSGSKRPSPETREMIRQVEIPSDAVRIGMFVVRLDREWTEVPLVFREFVVESEEQLEVLRGHCLSVTVEMSESQLRQMEKDNKQLLRKPLEAFPEKTGLVDELPVAHQHLTSAQNYINDLLSSVERDHQLRLDGFQEVVKNCVTSIMSNASAMFWLTKIRHEDAYTAEHCLRVGILAITFGRFLDFPEKDLQTLGMCGMLHDVGKMKIPNDVLNKPGALSPEEWQLMRQHPEFGHQLLREQQELDPVVLDAALSHHERLDGTGYPNGVSGLNISLFARLISIVDAYDAMTSDRPYMKGRSTAEALKILYKCSGNQFDGSLVEVFIRMIGVYPSGSLVELDSGEVAVVVSSRPNRKLQPLVEVVRDAHGHPCAPRIIDLAAPDAGGNDTAPKIRKALPDGIEGFDLESYIHTRGALDSQ